MNDAEARTLLREHGQEPPARGKLGPDWHELAESFTSGTEPGAEGEIDAGVTEPAALDGEVIAPPVTPAPAPAERRPRNVKVKAPAGNWRDKLWTGGKPPAKGKPKGKPKHARIPVDKLCSASWRGIGRIVSYVDVPVGRTLIFQAPAAGPILEDAVKGTFLDPIMQPLARAQQTGTAIAALVGPPVLVAALRQAEGMPEEQRKLRQAILLPLLEESMMMWARISGEKAEAIQAAAEEEGPLRAAVQAQIMAIFAPADGSPMPEDEQAARAQAMAPA